MSKQSTGKRMTRKEAEDLLDSLPDFKEAAMAVPATKNWLRARAESAAKISTFGSERRAHDPECFCDDCETVEIIVNAITPVAREFAERALKQVYWNDVDRDGIISLMRLNQKAISGAIAAADKEET